MANRRVAIVGASTSDCGRVDDKDGVRAELSRSTTRALASMRGSRSPRSTASCPSPAPCPRSSWPSIWGIRPNWVDSTGHGGSIWEFMVSSIAAWQPPSHRDWSRSSCSPTGRHQRADLKKKLTHGEPVLRDPRAHPGRGALRPPGGVALRHGGPAPHARVRHQRCIEQLAEVAVSTRYNESRASTPTPITRTRSRSTTCVEHAPMVWDPLTKLHCCIRTDVRW